MQRAPELAMQAHRLAPCNRAEIIGHAPSRTSGLVVGSNRRYIGATDKRGEDSIERICDAGDFLATIYHHLGIDAAKTMIRDFNGRPTPLVDHGRPIPELMG